MLEVSVEDLKPTMTLAAARDEIVPLLYDIMRLRLKALCAAQDGSEALGLQVAKKTARLDSLVIITMPDSEVLDDKRLEDRGAVLLCFCALEKAIEDSEPEYRHKAWSMLAKEAGIRASRLVTGGGT